MSKFSESGPRASYFNLPVGKVLAGLGAAMLLATPMTALAQSRQCSVTFTVTSSDDLGALQFSVDYAAAASKGDFASVCTFAQPAGETHVDTSANTMNVGWASTSVFAAPGLFATCTFVQPDSAAAAPVAGDFPVTVTAATDAENPPNDVTATLDVAVGSCVDAAPECQNGVIEQGEKCDDGNDEAGDGCDAACGLSDCETTPLLGCRTAFKTGKSKIQLKNNTKDLTDDSKDLGQYKWGGGSSTAVSEFADPVGGDAGYSWCVYDQDTLIRGATIHGGDATWKATGTKGFLYKGDAQGILLAKLKEGTDGKALILVKSKSKAGNWVTPALPLADTTTVVSQFVIDSAAPVCFTTTAASPPKKNDDKQYLGFDPK